MEKPKTLMFGFVTKTWNPIITRCSHECKYCYAQPILDKLSTTTGKYECLLYNPEVVKLREQELNPHFGADDIIFPCSMCDLFAANIPASFIVQIFNVINSSAAKFLLLTKNPQRMAAYLDDIPKNCIVGMTVETNRATTRWSKAPLPFDRFAAFNAFANEPFERFICIEPIMDFDIYPFAKLLHQALPHSIAIGYDNHNCRLPEPDLPKVKSLIELLKNEGFLIHYKTLRDRWDANWRGTQQ